jgi:hypothetical protein
MTSLTKEERDKIYKQNWYLKNKDKILANKDTSHEAKAKKAAYDKKRRELKGQQLREYDKERSSLPNRKAEKRNWSRKRKMSVKQATPNWLSELDELFIKEIYSLAVLRSNAIGIEYQVDHIIPLHGKNVCGLHVPDNLQLLSAKANQQKRHLYD